MKRVLHHINRFSWRSLQVRITLISLGVFLISTWSVYGYVSRQLHQDMEQMLGEQQLSTVTLHANEINRALSERITTLEKVTQLFAPAMHGKPGQLQSLLEQRPALPSMFSGGFFITDTTGTAIASFPAAANRLGQNYLDRDHVASALHQGVSRVSKPVGSKTLAAPVVALGVPIRDAQGKILGALVGVIDLAKPNFLDQIMSARYGKSGGYTLISKPWRMVVSATDKQRILQELPPPGANPSLDAFMNGLNGSALVVDTSGQDVLASVQDIPVADWALVASLPTTEAFAPTHLMLNSFWLATLIAMLLAASLTWWLLQYLLRPVHVAFRALKLQTESDLPLQPLPHTSQDEIGQLIGGFNQLFSVIRSHELELTRSKLDIQKAVDSLNEAQKLSQLGNWTLDLVLNKLEWSDEVFRIFEIDPQVCQASHEAFLQAIHPEDRDLVNRVYNESLKSHLSYDLEHRLLMPDGRIKWVHEHGSSVFDASGRTLFSVGVVQDITKRKLSEIAQSELHELLLSIIDLIPMRVFWKDANLHYLGCNKAFAHDAGKHHPAELIGQADYAMGWAAQADLYRADDRQVMESGVAKLFYDESQTTPDGKTIWLRTSKIPLKSQDGQVFGILGVYEDISDRKNAEMQLRKLSLVAEQSPESILITNLAGEIEYVNAAFMRNTGFSKEEVLGKNPRLLSSGKTARSTHEAMWQALSNGLSWSGELINRRKDGQLYVDRAVITPLRDPTGAVTHYVAVQEDGTEKKAIADELERHRHHLEELVVQRTDELNRARIQADESNRAKSEFLANMSHEIRTPMNGVVGMVDVLRQSNLNEKQKRMLDAISHSSLTLLRILNDILDFSKIEAGKLDVEQVPTALREVAQEVVMLMLDVPTSQSVELTLFVDPALPHWVVSDPTRLRQILLNLLGNAIKFVGHRAAKVALYVQPAYGSDGRACVQLSIIDNGIGMSAQTIEKLFLPFSQAEASTVRRYGGTGLGLSITQRLVNMLQGQINVQSAVGIGSEFTVELPLVSAIAPVQATAVESADLSGVHVLAVSAELSTTTLLQVYLQSVGASVSVLADGPCLLAQLASVPADTVLLLDTTTCQAQDNAVLLGRPLVRLVARDQHRTPAQAFEVLTHPVLYADLLHTVAIASGRSQQFAVVETSVQHLEQAPPPTVVEAQRAGRLVLMAEDNETNRDVVYQQLQLLGYAAEVAVDGEEALQMWQSGRYAMLLTDCHMPKMDGFELTAAIRQAEPVGQHKPIIAITANAMQGEAERCRAGGMDDYLSKPLRMHELGVTLAKWLPLPQAPAAAPIDASAPSWQKDPLVVWQSDMLNSVVGDDPRLHKHLLEKFLQNAHKQIDTLVRSMALNDLQTLTQTAHTLKSAARTVGAFALGELCQSLESAGRANHRDDCGSLMLRLPAAFELVADQIQAHLVALSQ